MFVGARDMAIQRAVFTLVCVEVNGICVAKGAPLTCDTSVPKLCSRTKL